MQYQVLARKWRPKIFSEVIGQEHITRTLSNAIKNQKVAHAYLLTGTRGVGKTSVARIFAKALRCTNKDTFGNPCLKCDSCQEIEKGTALDYIEIDGASNNKVEEARSLIENVSFLPSFGDYKIYVIDEVHMLTTQAFNALLKTLEEPPAHVVFIFATTDPQKLLGTVLSRCQRFDFKSVSLEDLISQVKKIAAVEKISFKNEKIIEKICKQGHGSVRDTLSILDQILSLSSNNQIDDDVLMKSMGFVKTDYLERVLNALFAGDKDLFLSSYQMIVNENIDLKIFSEQILDAIYEMIESCKDGVISQAIVQKQIVEELTLPELLWVYELLIKDIDWALKSFNPYQVVEMVLLKATLRRQILENTNEKLKVELTEKKKTIIETPKDKWREFIDYTYKTDPSVAINLDRARLLSNLDAGKIELAFIDEDDIFYENIQDQKNKILILLSEFLKVEINLLSLNIKTADNKLKKEDKVLNNVEVVKIEEESLLEERKNKILNNKYLKEVQTLFNGKIDKIVINK
jgi:DNA polymerase-3 subunit gamma/tau